MNTKEVEAYAKVSKITVHRWIKRGWVKAVQDGRTRRWTVEKESVDHLLNVGPPDPSYKNK